MPSWKDDPDRFVLRRDYGGDFVLFLNGILTRPGNQFAWTDRAERWMADHTSHEYDAIEYFHTPLLGPILGDGRVYREAIKLLEGYRDSAKRAGKPFRVHLVAHSHGCEIACRIARDNGIRITSASLIAAAIPASFERNGLNNAIKRGGLGRVGVHVSKGDAVLKWLPPMTLGLLYGRLGYEGPDRVDRTVKDRLHVTVRTDLGHSEWFAPEQFGRTMLSVNQQVGRFRLE
jgi:pimeloyl-ACP methyl ester carboxylesterase